VRLARADRQPPSLELLLSVALMAVWTNTQGAELVDGGGGKENGARRSWGGGAVALGRARGRARDIIFEEE
jgi:hypothetical protein